MAKEIVAVRLDPKMIERIDRLAAEIDDTRSGVIERILRQGLGEFEGWVDSFNNPFVRELFGAALESRPIIRLIAKAVGEELSEDEVANVARRTKLLKQKARQRSKRPSQRAGPTAEGA